MRPGQNKRMRGRPTNNRRGPNPLTRSYESNGPDVKIRGNAHHVAEKYLQLARDAHTGGDPVAAENYLQHAEHYFRLIAAAQAAQALAQSGQQRPPGEDEDDLDDDGDFGGAVGSFCLACGAAERLPAAATRISTATERCAERPTTVRRQTVLRARASGRQRSGRLCAPAGSSGQPISGPRSATRSPVPRPQRGLSRQSTRTRWSPTGFPALSRSPAGA